MAKIQDIEDYMEAIGAHTLSVRRNRSGVTVVFRTLALRSEQVKMPNASSDVNWRGVWGSGATLVEALLDAITMYEETEGRDGA